MIYQNLLQNYFETNWQNLTILYKVELENSNAQSLYMEEIELYF